ncbi:hypothetical protein L3X38_002286 [Prunus dulcis]|uniref:Uncharacterized protein n=1 Tax=Prunus dulcis TaxID=3755 RepID=A0AAD4WV73_PRUDU|nr:hypothetical protein L3X38_002286 [Prunus dulcis]
MASKKIQSVPATRGQSVNASFSSGDSAGVVTRSKAKAISVTQHVTSIPTQAKAKDVHRRREPVINLASLGQKKNTSRADERNSRSEGRSFSGSKNSRERSLSPVSDADSSTGSYHGSPPDDQQKKLTSASVGESYSMAMQVMVTGAMSIEEQLAHMSEAITKLTKMVEEKDAQIASLINNKWEGHQDKEPGQDAHKKGPHHEAESSEKRLGHETESGEKPHGKEEVAGKPNNQGGDGFIGDSSFDDNEGWTLVTRRKPRTKRIPQRQNTQSKRERRKRSSHKRSKTKTRIMVKRDSGGESGPLIQEPRIPITLEEYLPKMFFVRGPIETVYMTTCYQVDDEDVSEGRSETHEEQKALTQIEDSPSHLNVEEMVELPEAIRIALVKTLMDLNIHPNQIREAKKLEPESQDRAICCATCASITFTDEDLLLGSKPHNRPLFVFGYVREQKLSRMLVDGGSAVNIMPKSTMIKLGITVDELSRSRVMIQGFNQGGQRAMGMIRIELVIGDLRSNTLFHVIDAKTSYNLLLERPWVHENGIVPSTLHQCFKFYRGGVKKILGDVKPFTEAESYFADAKFYIDEDVASEVIPVEVHSTGQAIPRKDEQSKCLFVEENSDNKPKNTAFGQMGSLPIDSQKVAIPVLRYVSSSRRKEGQSPFGEEVKPRKLGKSDMKFLKEFTTMPLPKLSNSDVSKSSVPRFVRPLQDATRREYLPVKRTKEGFDPNAYKLMSKADYDFGLSSSLGELNPDVTGERTHGLSETQKKLKEQGYTISSARTGLGFTHVPPVKISARRKEKKAEAQHISVEVVEEEEEPKAIKRASVFDRLAKPTQRTSVFGRIKESISRPSVFKRISRHQNQRGIQLAPHISALERLGVPSQPSEEEKKRELESGVLVDSTEDNEIRSLIPSRMKRLSTLDFPLPIIELMVDATTGHEALSLLLQGDAIWPQECRLRKYQLKMNLLKCAFGVTSSKFLGFIVKHRGIEVDQTKIKAIRDMPEPRNLHELKSLQGRLAFIRQFISNLAGRCQPFSRLMKKDVPFVWDEACHNAFESIKKYLSSSPLLGAPIPGKQLKLYIAAQERSIGALLAEENESRKEQALYYLSRTLTGPELNYTPIEKTCLALVFAIQKLRHYMQAFTVHLIARADPAVKGQAVADFLADHPIPADWEISDDLPDEQVFFADVSPAWMMFFDGSACKDGAGAGVVFVSPERHVLPYSFSLSELCSNNVAEYQALIMGLQMAVEMKISSLEVYGDSMLVINQLLTHYEVRKDDLIPYHQLATQLLESFDFVTLEHVPRKDNQMADALANLAATLALTKEEAINLPVCQRWVVPLTLRTSQEGVNVISVLSIDVDDWRQPLIDYLEHGKLPDDSRHRSEVRRRAPRFIYYKEILYRRSFEGVFLRCLDEEDAFKAMEEAHSGICGAHQSGPKLHFQIKRMGYYWPTMVKDCMDYVKKCQACQFHANFIHQPPEPLHPTITSWPFDAWGLDVVGPIAPKSSDGHSYILAATDYFSKWAEAVPLKEVKKENVVSFIKVNIINRYGVPRYIITDNGKPFSNRLMDKLCEDFGFKQRNSSMYNAPANGLAEAFNKTLCSLLKKVVGRTKKDWHERINEALWAYRTTYRTPTQATPYSLVYGVEAVLPLESQLPSLRMAIQEGLTDEENAKLRLQE